MFVTVILPVYNGLPYLKESMTSILAQDHDFELVVSDDGSTDGTVEYLRSLSDSRLRVLINKDNAGIFGNLNRCIEAAKGTAIQIFSQDDIMCPGFLTSQVSRLNSNPDAGLVYGAPLYIDSEGSVIVSNIRDDTPERIDKLLYVWIASHYSALPASISSVMIPRRTIETIGVFNPAFRVAGDIEYYNRVSEQFIILRNKDVLHKVRSHRRAASALSSAGPLYLKEEILLDRWYRDRWIKGDFAKVQKFKAAVRGGYHLGWMRRALFRGEVIKTLKALPAFHALYPLHWVIWWQIYKRIFGTLPKPFLPPP